MRFFEGGDAFWSGNDTDHVHIFSTFGFNLLDALRCRAAGGEHGIQDEYLSAGAEVGHLSVVALCLRGSFITLHPDVTDTRTRDNPHGRIEHTQTRAKYRNKNDARGKLSPIRNLEWRLHLNRIYV